MACPGNRSTFSSQRFVKMDKTIQFRYSDKTYSAEVVSSFNEKPFYFFILFNSKDLIEEFGDELSIATDGKSILNLTIADKKVGTLKEAIFQEIQKVPEYNSELSKAWLNLFPRISELTNQFVNWC